MVDLVSIRIAVISHKIPSKAVKFVKMFRLQLLEVNLNTVPKIIVFDVCGYILIEPIYDVLVEDVIVSYLNIHTVGKKNFSIDNLEIEQKCARDI